MISQCLRIYVVFCPKSFGIFVQNFYLDVKGKLMKFAVIGFSCMGFLSVSGLSAGSAADVAQLIPLDKLQLSPQVLKIILDPLVSRLSLTRKCCFKELWRVPLKSQRDRNIVLFRDRFASGTSPKQKSKLPFQSWGLLLLFWVGFFFWKDCVTLSGGMGIHQHIQTLCSEKINCSCTTSVL